MTGKEYIEDRINTGDRFLQTLHKEDREKLVIRLEDYAALCQPPVSGSLPIEEVALHAADDWFDTAKFRGDIKADLISYYEGYRDAMWFCQGNDR